MNGSGLLLDTNCVIAIFANESSALDLVANSKAASVPAIVIGELCYGAYNSARIVENLARIADLHDAMVVMPCDVDTAVLYGRIKNDLRLIGTPIPENDIWIAAIAMQHDLVVATRDKHFAKINSLSTTQW